MSALSQFIRALHEGGQVPVAEDGPHAEEPASLRAAVAMAIGVAVRAAPGAAPEADPALVAWAFTRLYHGCRLLAFRHLGEGEIAPALTPPAPATGTDAAHFAVDVAFRHLPAAYVLAERTSVGDPLLVALRALAEAWPLAAVGIAGTAPVPGPVVLGDPCLAALYVDRVLAAGDAARATHPEVRALIAAALGAHPDLAPVLRGTVARTAA